MYHLEYLEPYVAEFKMKKRRKKKSKAHKYTPCFVLHSFAIASRTSKFLYGVASVMNLSLNFSAHFLFKPYFIHALLINFKKLSNIYVEQTYETNLVISNLAR